MYICEYKLTLCYNTIPTNHHLKLIRQYQTKNHVFLLLIILVYVKGGELMSNKMEILTTLFLLAVNLNTKQWASQC